MPHHGLLASQASRLEALKTRHSALAQQIEKERLHISIDDFQLKGMKLQKLHLKEQIQELEDIERYAANS